MAFSGFQDFTPQFSGSLQQFLAANPGITVGSGYRSPERQAELYRNAVAKYGSEDAARHWVAPPGKSQHNMRLAADLQFKDAAARQWAHANAAKYGLIFPMGHEPWHVELVGARDQAPGSAEGVSNTLAEALAVPDELDKDPVFNLSGLASSAGKRLSGGGPQGLTEQGSAPPIDLPIEPITPSMAAQQGPAQAFAELAPLAELFKIKDIGQAGTPALPGRRF